MNMSRHRIRKTISSWRVPINTNSEVNKGRLWKDNPCCPEVIRKQIKKMEYLKKLESKNEIDYD
jgi:hypothetical protein